jgi:hypothetical protein
MLLVAGSADYSLVIYSQHRLVYADVYVQDGLASATKTEKHTAPSQFGIVCATNW